MARSEAGFDSRWRSAENGFTLIEALVALAILAGMTAALVTVVAEDARARRVAQGRRVALDLAQSALDRASVGEGGDSGAWGPYRWQVARSPVGAPDPFAGVRAERLSVRVGDAEHASLVALETVRVRP